MDGKREMMIGTTEYYLPDSNPELTEMTESSGVYIRDCKLEFSNTSSAFQVTTQEIDIQNRENVIIILTADLMPMTGANEFFAMTYATKSKQSGSMWTPDFIVINTTVLVKDPQPFAILQSNDLLRISIIASTNTELTVDTLAVVSASVPGENDKSVSGHETCLYLVGQRYRPCAPLLLDPSNAPCIDCLLNPSFFLPLQIGQSCGILKLH